MAIWKSTHEWTPQREWIHKSGLVLATFPQETEFQEEQVKMSMIAEKNLKIHKRWKLLNFMASMCPDLKVVIFDDEPEFADKSSQTE